jgi:hypothetical protein
MSRVITVLTLVSTLTIAAASQPAWSAPAAEPDPSLVPCLAVAADGSPVWPATSFPSSKRVTVAFKLPPDATAKKLDSQWFFVGEQDAIVAENSLDLDGQKSGWLRLALKQRAPAGKYRLDTLLDGKQWKSVEFVITEPIETQKDAKPADLCPLVEGATMTYEMADYPAKGTTAEIPGVKPDADGVSRATLALSYGKTEDVGTHHKVSINDQLVGETWVKLDDEGLWIHRRKLAETTEDVKPPQLTMPLPPALADLTEWSCKSAEGGQQKLTLFGPMMIDGSDGPAAGYMVFIEEQISVGSPGVPASRGKQTIQRYFIPKVGLVREVRHSMLGGEPTGRFELVLASGKPYRLVANPNMKGRLGRIAFEYPKDTKYSDARTTIFKADAKPQDKPVAEGYGDAGFDLMPGKYLVAINSKRVPVEVKSGHNTITRCGVLRVHAGSETHFNVLDSDKKRTQLYDAYGEKDIALPVGTYFLEIGGASEEVTISDGRITEF